AHRVALLRGWQRLAQGERLLDPVSEELAAHGFPRVEGPYPGADLRFRAVGGERKHLAGGVAHLEGVARFAARLLDRTGEDPRVAALERFLAASLQDHHFLRARGCAAS